jgi:hypothetical protein
MVDDGLELLALDDGQHGGKADDELLLLDDGRHGGMADDDDDLLDALDDLLDADACCLDLDDDACCLDLDDDDALLAATGGLPDLADDGASPSATDDATSNPLPNTKRRRVDGAPGGAELRGARPWGRDSPFLPAEDVAIWEFAYDEGGAPAVEHRQRRDPGGQLLWAKALADGKFSRRGAAVRNDAAGRKMLRNRLAYLKKRRDADPDGFEAALDDARAARDALRDGARPDLSESGGPPAADACVLCSLCGAPGEDYHKKPTIIKFVEGQTGFATLLIWVAAILTFIPGNYLWGGVYAALAFLHGLQVWYMNEHGDCFWKLFARPFGQKRAQLTCALLVVFEAVLIIGVVTLIQYALAQ